MACYYLVISSTHLSNGHFRSIKGVFRGPLCKTDGGDSPDYAEKEKAIAKALEDLKANFYCELCDKQYHKHQEFDNHINSYDHAHKQRLKELKQREFARNVASKSWKDEKKQEKALKRLHQLAELRKQTECSSGSGPKFRATTATANEQQKEKVSTTKESRSNDHYSAGDGDITFGSDSKNSQVLFVSTGSGHTSDGRIGLQSTVEYNQRSGVSFCFSKKAQLKLESSASVFSDTNDAEEPQSQKVKQAIETFLPYISGPDDTVDFTEDENPENQNKVKLKLESQESEPDRPQTPATQSRCEKQNCPVIFLSNLENNLCKEKAEINSNAAAATDFEECRAFTSYSVLSDIHRGTCKGNISHEKQTVKIQGSAKNEKSTLTVWDSQMFNREDLQSFTNDINGTSAVKEILEPSYGLNKNIGPFLDVLNKDGSMMLKWPSELLMYTQTEPSISYSCNPLYFDFKCSRKKQGTQDDTQLMQTNDTPPIAANARRKDSENEKMKENTTEKLTLKHSNYSKPKKPKHYKRYKTYKQKSIKKAHCGWQHSVIVSDNDAVNAYLEQDNIPKIKGLFTSQLEFKKRKRLGYDNEMMEQNANNWNSTCSVAKKSKLFTRDAPTNMLKSHEDVISRDTYLNSSGTFTCFHEDKKKCLSVTSNSHSSFSELDTESEGQPSQLSTYSPSNRSSIQSPLNSSYSKTDETPSSSNKSFSNCHFGEDSTSSDSHDSIARMDSRHHDYKSIYRRKGKKDLSFFKETDYDESDAYCRYSRSRYFRRKHQQKLKQSQSRSSVSSSTSTQSNDHILSYYSSSRKTQSSRSRHSSCSNSLSKTWPSSLSKESGHYLKCTLSNSRKEAKVFGRPPHFGLVNVELNSKRENVCNGSNSEFISEHLPEKKVCVLQSALGKDQLENSSQDKTKDCSVSCVKVKNRSLACSGSRTAPLITNTLGLPLIGKLPAAKKQIKKGDHDKANMQKSNREKGAVSYNKEKEHIFGDAHFNAHLPGEVKETAPGSNNQSSERIVTEQSIPYSKKEDPGLLNCSPNVQDIAGRFSSLDPVDSNNDTQAHLLNLRENSVSKEDISLTASELHAHCKVDTTSELEPNSKCVSPPLTEQPIIFTPDEIDKYRLLQLQAQQHMQQQLLSKHIKVLPPADLPNFSAAQAFHPIPVQQPSPMASIRHALFQHHALAAFTSGLQGLHPHTNHQPLPHLHPFPPPHLTPISLSPIASAIFPAHPAALLTGHPLHIIPASSLRPAHLALHSLPHSALLPALLAPSPAMAAVAASALQLHPFLHPVFPGQDLPPHSCPNT
ncbi:zinc finger protein 804B isoform X1 [Polypterus senegalus]|uniref:zinc finger protein 804B isoform X1 n=1 Tax=Polypterus senegalus TaxID=55291 RepID=UPI001962A1FF|nr:zinc finger protein 804B isoform X1 [Polypterus senegalus]